MTVPSHAVQMLQLEAVASFLDQGGANATLIYYDDTKPADESVSANPSARLVTLNLPNPCVKTIAANAIELKPTDVGVAIKTGIATWARLYSASGEVVVDLEMGTDIVLDSYNILIGSSQKLDVILIEPE